MPGLTIHTERGDVVLTRAEMRLYQALDAERFKAHSKQELCQALRLTVPELDALAITLRERFAQATGLRMVQNVWGVAYRLDHTPADPDLPSGSMTPARRTR